MSEGAGLSRLVPRRHYVIPQVVHLQEYEAFSCAIWRTASMFPILPPFLTASFVRTKLARLPADRVVVWRYASGTSG